LSGAVIAESSRCPHAQLLRSGLGRLQSGEKRFQISACLNKGAAWRLGQLNPKRNESDLALKILEDQRNKGYNTWIEDENGAAVDERSLKMTSV
jgi:predicted negative regulator of RcsB-dependent stress response